MKYLCIKYRQIIVPNFFLLRVMAGCGFHPYDMNNLQLSELCLRLNKQNTHLSRVRNLFSPLFWVYVVARLWLTE
jgi:hypothetical protein